MTSTQSLASLLAPPLINRSTSAALPLAAATISCTKSHNVVISEWVSTCAIFGWYVETHWAPGHMWQKKLPMSYRNSVWYDWNYAMYSYLHKEMLQYRDTSVATFEKEKVHTCWFFCCCIFMQASASSRLRLASASSRLRCSSSADTCDWSANHETYGKRRSFNYCHSRNA